MFTVLLDNFPDTLLVMLNIKLVPQTSLCGLRERGRSRYEEHLKFYKTMQQHVFLSERLRLRLLALFG